MTRARCTEDSRGFQDQAPGGLGSARGVSVCHLSHEDKQGPRLTGSRMPAPGLRGRARHAAVRAQRPRASRSGCFERRRRCRWACSVLCPAWRPPRRPRWGSAFLSGARARMDEPPKGDPGLLPVCLEANRSGRLSLCPAQAARCALGGCGRWTAPAWPPPATPFPNHSRLGQAHTWSTSLGRRWGPRTPHFSPRRAEGKSKARAVRPGCIRPSLCCFRLGELGKATHLSGPRFSHL